MYKPVYTLMLATILVLIQPTCMLVIGSWICDGQYSADQMDPAITACEGGYCFADGKFAGTGFLPNGKFNTTAASAVAYTGAMPGTPRFQAGKATIRSPKSGTPSVRPPKRPWGPRGSVQRCAGRSTLSCHSPDRMHAANMLHCLTPGPNDSSRRNPHICMCGEGRTRGFRGTKGLVKRSKSRQISRVSQPHSSRVDV